MWAGIAGLVMQYPGIAKMLGAFAVSLVLIAPAASCARAEHRLSKSSAALLQAQADLKAVSDANEANAATSRALAHHLQTCIGTRELLKQRLQDAVDAAESAREQQQQDIDEGERTRIVLVERSPEARDWMRATVPDDVAARWRQ